MSGNQQQGDAGQVPGFGTRHIQVILLFFLLTIGVGMRLQLAVAIVAMTDSKTSPNPNVPTYDWDNKSVILSSFYWGYITVQLAAGALGRIYGTKKLLIGAMFFNATACCLIPTVASTFGSYGVMVCRVFQGVSQGFFYPSIYNLLGRWAPMDERSRLGTIALGGYAFGSIVTNPLVGFMSSTWWGWPSTFYLYAAVGFLWMILWTCFGASSPADHKNIMREERNYIETSLGQVDDAEKNIPWKAILTSVPVWVLSLASIGNNWGLVFLGTETPLYMNKIMKFDIKSNGLLASAPSIATFITNFLFAYLSDYAINLNYLSRGATRKVFTTIAFVGMAIPLLIICYLPKDANASSVTMLIITGFFNGAVYGGSGVNQIDLSPRFAGIVMAITNSVCNAVGLLAPLMVQAIVTDEANKSQWRIMFLITVGIYISTNLVYVLFASGELQEWNSYGQKPGQKVEDTPKTRKISRKISMVVSGI